MITYLKNDNSVIKVDSETQSLTLITTREGSLMLRHDFANSPLFTDVTVTKYNEGVFVDATEEEFLAYRTMALSKLD
jgi:hypothetical protein